MVYFRYNFEIKQQFRDYGKVDLINIQQLGGARYWQMGDDRMPKRVMTGQMLENRRRGSPTIRWRDSIEKDAKEILGAGNREAAAPG